LSVIRQQSYGQDICSQIDYINEEVKVPSEVIDTVEAMLHKYPHDSLSIPEWDLIYYKHANAYFKAQQYDKSLELCKKYLKWTQTVHFADSRADFYNTIGSNYYYLDQLDSAAHYYVLAANRLKYDGKEFYYAAVMNNIGVIYLGEKDYAEAIKYYKKTKNAFVDMGDSTYLSSVLGNIGYSYFELREIDSSRYYSQAAMAVGEQQEYYEGYFNGLMTLAEIDALQGDTTASILKNKQVYSKAQELKDDNYRTRAAQSLAAQVKDEKQGLAYAREAYEYGKARNQYLEESFLLTLAHLLRKNNEGELAYDLIIPRYYEKDSMLTARYDNQKIELLQKYEAAEKERVILTQQNEITKRDLDINRLLLGLLALLLLGLSLLAYVLYQKNKTERKQQEYETRFAQLETMVLKSQMNPHFIFNSLNSIRYLFMKDEKEKGIKYITKFAKLLRTTLHHGDEALISLRDEIELTELFVDLEQLRFDDQFTFTTTYDDSDWQSVMIPPFVVQPIVENAFWHGLRHSHQSAKNLDLSVSKQGNSFVIEVADNGVGYGAATNSEDSSVNKKKSYGLSIIRERFELLNKTGDIQYAIEITKAHKYDTGTAVYINITPSDI